jgi:hypothetical protein
MTPSFLTSAAAPTEGVELKVRHCCLAAHRAACFDTVENILALLSGKSAIAKQVVQAGGATCDDGAPPVPDVSRRAVAEACPLWGRRNAPALHCLGGLASLRCLAARSALYASARRRVWQPSRHERAAKRRQPPKWHRQRWTTGQRTPSTPRSAPTSTVLLVL